MRVVGYVREAPGPDTGETVFMQGERIRRWVLRNGHHLVAICQDPRPGSSRRDGLAALLRVLEASDIEGVVVPSLEALSADKILQEIILWDLRARGAAVVSTEEADLLALQERTPDASRLLLRDVLAKQGDYSEQFGGSRSDTAASVISEAEEVMVELID